VGVATEEHAFRAPQPLADSHDLSRFACGEPGLDNWLRRKARANQLAGGSRTFVITVEGVVVGFYSLATATLSHAEATGAFRRNMPEPIPMLLLGRLAVDTGFQGRGLGDALLRDALLRCFQVSAHVGARGVLVHALSDSARRFYVRWRFAASPVDPMTLMLRMSTMEDALGQLPE